MGPAENRPESTEPRLGAPARPASLLPHVTNLDLARILRLARKELREILRDRRTIITLIAMPLLLYPLMSVAFQQFVLERRVTKAPLQYNVGHVTAAESSFFDWRFTEGQTAWLKAQKLPPGQEREWLRARKVSFVWFSAGAVPRDDQERASALETLQGMLRRGEIDLIVSIPGITPEEAAERVPKKDRYFQCTIYAMPNSPIARQALGFIDNAFASLNEQNLKKRLGLPDAQPRILMLSLDHVFLETDAHDGLIALDALVPLVLILMTITGAVYPAIDLTAGEHERGTLEILVATPVPRFELLSAKYLSVVAVAVLNAIVNLICMSITVSWSGLGSVLIAGGLSAVLILEVFGLLILFAAFFSAVLLCITSLARSFKEAQAYLIPLMLASLAPGVMAMLPGLELTRTLRVVPLLNVVLLTRDLFGAGTDLVTALTVILTTLLYAFAALSLAARLFGAESVLYNEQSSWSDLLRRPDTPQPAATLPAGLWCLALMLPIHFVLFAVLRYFEPSLLAGIFWQIAVTVLMFGLMPAYFLHLGRVDLTSGLGLKTPRWPTLLAAVLLGSCLWPLELWLLLRTIPIEMLQERFSGVLDNLKAARQIIGWGIFAIVILPAILEEFFFRGMLFQALRMRTSAWLAIGLSALLFGLAHVILGGPLGLERLLPSLLMGLILGTVCWYTGSLWPSMILHVCHNVLLLMIGLRTGDATASIPWSWLAGSGVGISIAAALLWLGGRAGRSNS